MNVRSVVRPAASRAVMATGTAGDPLIGLTGTGPLTRRTREIDVVPGSVASVFTDDTAVPVLLALVAATSAKRDA